MANCQNCGAPVDDAKPRCEYCGTRTEKPDDGDWVILRDWSGEEVYRFKAHD